MSPGRPVRRRRGKLSEHVVARIKESILENDLRPGDPLPTELAMAKLFGVSRTSVREATKALGFLGIVDAAPRRGLRVGQFNMERISQYLGFHFAVSRYPAELLLRARMVIETGALPFILENMRKDPAVEKRLAAVVRRHDRARSIDKHIQIDIAFHRELISSSGIAPLIPLVDFLHAFFHRFHDTIASKGCGDPGQAHARLLNVLRKGSLPAARRELEKHLSYYSVALSEDPPEAGQEAASHC